MKDLSEARAIINAIDKEMAALFERRMEAVEDVILYKKEHQLPVFDSRREEAVIQNNLPYIKQAKYKESYRKFLIDLMNTSKEYQKQVLYQDCVGYQGGKGAFSYIVSNKLCKEFTKKQYETFEDVFKAVMNNEVRFGIVPLENSYTGEIGEVLDLLIQYPLYIDCDYKLKISQNLLGIKGAKLEDIKTVYSKDQAIYQSKQFLQGRGYEEIPYANTALAAQYVASMQDKTKAAIAAKETAELYGLEILASDINTSEQNHTRFIKISKELKQNGNVVALAIIVPHQAGALVNAMNVISEDGYNMQSIISRSIKKRPWEYYFYIEIEGNMNDEKLQKVVEKLKDVCEKVKVLGVYTKESRDEK